MLQTAIRTRQSVILDDAASAMFSADVYVQHRRPRSVLCLPLVKQAKLVGALYLENNLTPRAFTPGRIAVLELLASQAAISLENAVLYPDLQQVEEGLRRSESYLSEAQRLSHTGSFGWRPSSGAIYRSEETFRIFEFDRATTLPWISWCANGFTRKMLPLTGRWSSAQRTRGRILLMSIDCGCQMAGPHISRSSSMPSELKRATLTSLER